MKLIEVDIINTLTDFLKNNKIIYGKYDIINRTLSVKYSYPIKIIFSIEADKLIIISAYPLKRGYENEDIL